ncbi:hypothetical protein MXD81_18055, partial [Microbacteriaceae bacterium K1510]|nr:hypothetical protein [Microbacteriaceae bacterium K1510]
PQLRAALVQQGLQVDRLEVSQQSQQPQLAYQQQREQARQQHGGNQPQKQQAKEEQPEFSIESLVDRAEPLATVISRLRMRGNVEYSA